MGQKQEVRTWYGSGSNDYYSEIYTYDSAGNIKTAQARNGAVTTYEYDKLNRKTLDVLPVIVPGVPGVSNAYAYDAQGNLTTKIEAVGLPEQRVTRYRYDKLNRQIEEIGEDITTLALIDKSVTSIFSFFSLFSLQFSQPEKSVDGVDVVVTPTAQRGYDARGNLTTEIDVRGGRTVHYYDRADREIGRIDPAGAYTVWTYDAAGNKLSETAYAMTVAVAGNAISVDTAPVVLGPEAALPLAGAYVIRNDDVDRTISYQWDGVGRLLGSTIANVRLGRYNPIGSAGPRYEVTTGAIVTRNTYDAMGNLIASKDPNGNVTRRYYDRAGQLVGQLDALRYLTVWTRDACGDVLRERQYANPVDAALNIGDGSTLDELINMTSPAPTEKDRVTTYAYDRLGRKKTESRLDVARGLVFSNSALFEGTADAMTGYAYDGLSNVTSKTDATGAVTDWVYDALGRKTQERRPSYTDYLGNTVRPVTDYEYDGLNHVKREIARGTDGATESDDRVTTYTYGAGGYLTGQTDAAGARLDYRIDAAGNIVSKTLNGRKNADGVSVNDVTYYWYDKLNREIQHKDGAFPAGASEEVRYNAFGQISGKRTNGGGADTAWAEFTDYDRAGRAWRGDVGDGVTKVYVFDANGNATLSINDATTDLRPLSLTAVLALTDTNQTVSVFDARNQLSGTFGTLAGGGAVQQTLAGRPGGSQKTNAFGEVVRETDSLGHVTDLSYNTLGKLILKQDPEISVTLSNGYQQTVRPATTYVYDLSGRLAAKRDANGHQTKQMLLAGGELVASQFNADNSKKQNGYDIFGDLRYGVDEIGRRTDYSYDRDSRLIRIDRPAHADKVRAYDTYAYDAAGNRISHGTTPGGGIVYTDKTYYDSLARVTRSVTALGRQSNYAYAWDANITGAGGLKTGGWRKTSTDPVGRSIVDETDAFGHTTKHTDLGKHTFTYKFNFAGWLDSQTGSSGQNIGYQYYANGYVKKISDYATGAVSDYEYDAAGNRTYEAYRRTVGGVTEYQQPASISYDSSNRVIRIQGQSTDIRYEYDAVGNRRRVWSYYQDGVDGTSKLQDYWYAYDNMDRATVTMGQLSSAGGARGASENDSGVSVKLGGGESVELHYDMAGERTYIVSGRDGHREDYTYGAEGYLEDTYVSGTGATKGALTARRVNDLLGQTWSYTEFNGVDGAISYERRTVYDADNRQSSQFGTDGALEYSYYVDDSDRQDMTTLNGAGELACVFAIIGSGTSTVTTTTTTKYAYWDQAKQTVQTISASDPALENNSQWKPGTSSYTYDVNGHLTGVLDTGADGVAGTGDDVSVQYTSNAQGMVLRRVETSATVNKLHRYLYVNGAAVGDVGNDGDAHLDYAQTLAQAPVSRADMYRNWKPVSSADFDQNYQPINRAYPAATASGYVVKTGDVLQSVAAAEWGDANLWYLIAEANGLGANADLRPGQTLIIPNKVANLHNTSATMRPYDAGAVMGDTSPTLPDAPPPPQQDDGGGCGGLGSIIVAIVVVVATVYTAGAAATYFGAVEGTLSAATVAGAAVGGAVGSAAGQLAGMAMGMQSKFNWGAVATGALTSMATVGVSSFTSGLNVSSSLKTVLGAVAQNVAGQGIGMLMGQQKSFSWASVAASAISAPLMTAANNAVFGAAGGKSGFGAWASDNPFAAQLARSSVSALVSATTRMVVVGGRMSWQAVAADAVGDALRQSIDKTFGNALGSSLGSQSSGHEGRDIVDAFTGPLLATVGYADGSMSTDTPDGRPPVPYSRAADPDGVITINGLKSTLYMGGAGNPIETWIRPDGVIQNYADGYSKTDLNGETVFTSADMSWLGVPLTETDYNFASSRQSTLSGYDSPGMWHDLKAWVDGGIGVTPNPVRTPDQETELTSLRGITSTYVDAVLNPEKYSPALQELDHIRSSVTAGATFLAAHELGVDTASRQKLVALSHAASDGAFARATAVSGGPAYTGARGPYDVETLSPAQTSIDNLAGRARTDKLGMGIRFESVQGSLDNYTEYSGHTATQLYMRAFDSNGALLPGSVRMDRVGLREDGGYDFIDYKLSKNSPLTGNQQVHYPAFGQNGGVITGLRGQEILLPKGTIFPPTSVIIRPGPLPQLSGNR